MSLTIEELLQGKKTIIKNKEYFSTREYVEPFLDRMSKYTNNFIVQAKQPNQISITEHDNSNSNDIIYNRVNVEAILPDELCDGHKKVVGFVYALDTRKPIVKIYTGALRSACLNLCVFNPEALQVCELQPETPINYKFVDICMTMIEDYVVHINKLNEIVYTKEECFNTLGVWIDKVINTSFTSGIGKVKLSETTPIDAYKNVFYNEKSPYYTKESYTTGFNIYNSFTDILCNGVRADIINRFEKTFLVSKIMNI